MASNTKAPPRISRREKYSQKPPVLNIRVNHEFPGAIVPGSQRLYCYWKNRLYIDAAKQTVDLYVPPEWRSIDREYLSRWMEVLRMCPYQSYSFGLITYRWVNDLLIPTDQDMSRVPLAGLGGWPILEEEVIIWANPLRRQGSETNLPVMLNRVCCAHKGMERMTCYWAIKVPGTPKEKFYVPPEWRQISKETRMKWILRAIRNRRHPIVIAGVTYTWHTNILAPIGQQRNLIHCIGMGNHRNLKARESENESENECEVNSEEEVEEKGEEYKKKRETKPSYNNGGKPKGESASSSRDNARDREEELEIDPPLSPIFPDLTEEDIDHIIRSFIGQMPDVPIPSEIPVLTPADIQELFEPIPTNDKILKRRRCDLASIGTQYPEGSDSTSRTGLGLPSTSKR